MKITVISSKFVNYNSLNKNQKRQSLNGESTPMLYAQVPQMGLLSFGSKESSLANLLKGVKKACTTSVKFMLLDWERATTKPSKKRLNEIADSLSKLDVLKQKQTIDPIIKKSLAKLQILDPKTLNDFNKGLIRTWNKAVYKAEKLPPKFIEAKSKLVVHSSKAWEEARENNNFKHFEPYLAEMFIATRKEANYIDPQKAPLDVLLEDFGYTSDEVSGIFNALRNELVPIVKEIKQKSKINQEILNKPANIKQLQDFAIDVVKDMGVDMSRVTLGKTEHSFMSELDSPFRIGIAISQPEAGAKTTIADCIDVLTSLTHEAGHGLVELGASSKLNKTGLTGAVLNIHESQSRLWENNVGRSKEFLQNYFPLMQKKIDGFQDITFEELYDALNFVQPSLIRTQADEVTYNLHVIIRHEIEKELLNPKNTDEDIRNLVKKLPENWNNKYEEYLGVRPKTDSEGVLQDVHWSEGLIGYFPSYTLGNLASAQFMKKASEEIPNLEQKIASGDLKTLSNWLKQKIYTDGQIYTPDEILKRVTGEPLNPKYFIEYLKKKYL